VAIGLVALAMSGFGVDLIQRRHEPYAIKVNERLISFDDFNQERRALEQRYREMFGQNYNQIVESLRLNLKEQAKDTIIADTLLEEKARALGFHASNNAVAQIIHKELFPEGFNVERYRLFLQSIGLTSQQFEESVRRQVLRSQLTGLLNNISFASRRETETAILLEDTRYSLDYLEISPDSFAKVVTAKTGSSKTAPPAPSEAEIEAYYHAHNTEYETPARVAYDYVVFDPQNFVDRVEVSPEDIEIFYADNLSRFTTAEEIKVRHIQFNIPPQADPAKKEEIKKKAESVLAKAHAGESFEALAKGNSSDVLSAPKGGDLGWIRRGKMGQAFDETAFKLLEGEVSDLVETAEAFHIIKVEEHRPERQKELDEVRAEIEMEIRRREAPAYAKSKAEDWFAAFQTSELPLPEFAAQHKLGAVKTSGLLQKDSNPEGLPNLTTQVMEARGDTKQLIDIGEKSVLVSVTDYREPETQPLSAVRDKVIEALYKEAARKLARETAQNIIDQLNQGTYKSLREAGVALKLPVQESKDLTRAKVSGIFLNPELQSAVFSTAQEMQKPTRFFEVGQNFYLFQVTMIQRPKPEEVQTRVQKARRQESRRLGEILLKSLLNKLKAEAKIDIDPAVLAED